MKKSLLLLVMMLSTLSSWAVEEEYDLWVWGERVTSENCNDLLWGMVRYDASSNTLTIDSDCWITNNFVNDYAIVNGIVNLNIQINGNCGIEGMKGAIYSTEFFIISGSSADESIVYINDNNADSPAIYAEKGVLIQWCNVLIYGVLDTSIEGGKLLTMNGGKLYSNVVKGFEDMRYYNDSYLVNPKGGQYDTVNKVLGGGSDYVEVDVRIEYHLSVAGVVVTNENAADILNDNTVSYNSSTKTLTLNNANIEYEAEVIRSTIDDLSIQVIGDNVLTTHYGCCIDYQGNHLIIAGYTPSKSTLKFQQISEGTEVEDGASFFGGSTLIKRCTVSGYKIINVIYDEPVNLELYRARIAVENIEGFDEVKISNGYIESPEVCSYDITKRCFMSGSHPVTSLHIEPYLLAFNGQDVTPTNPIVTKSGVATYDAVARMLTLNNAELGEMTSGKGLAFYDDLTIKLEGNNTLSAKSGALCFEAGDLTIQGPGLLQILANEEAFVGSSDINAFYFNVDQYFTMKRAYLVCWTYGCRSTANDLVYKVINSNFTFEKNLIGYELFTCKHLNLFNSKLVEPEDYTINDYYPLFDGKFVIEAFVDDPGDIDCDGEFTVADVIGLTSLLNSITSGVDITEYDVNSDGTFTKEDVDALVDIVLKND